MEARTAAIVLAAGRGSRMKSKIQKQYLLLKGKPVLYYSLKAFEESFIDEIILVTGEEEIEYCRKEIVEKYGFTKVSHIVTGGKERYHSVFCGLQALTDCDYVFIHDGARPFVTEQILERAYETVQKEHACVVGMPVKDTIKLADENGFAKETPRRDLLWMIQTPQVFSYALVKTAYASFLEREQELLAQGIKMTDDAMVVETFTDTGIRLVEGSYENIKITTPEDLRIAEALL
ncbi:MAG: 2-C-methyl-D-erythritol 4-phosphate cytidylyltransferase [Lachnospiraceae bacterium]|nr:2-C-methyl-D-erythritol 4-phosphate cytidylyltransferase [Lachnospiraceae bacterium]